jgi:hypothetical protein
MAVIVVLLKTLGLAIPGAAGFVFLCSLVYQITESQGFVFFSVCGFASIGQLIYALFLFSWFNKEREKVDRLHRPWVYQKMAEAANK